MPEMEIVERQVGRVVIMDLHGRIVIGHVPFIDSSVVGELVRSLTTVSRRGGTVKFLNLPPRIGNLLSMARLLTVFETYESEDEAVRSF
jgi:anti-sigma B factor antagonist